jgi:hypothetical protein
MNKGVPRGTSEGIVSVTIQNTAVYTARHMDTAAQQQRRILWNFPVESC